MPVAGLGTMGAGSGRGPFDAGDTPAWGLVHLGLTLLDQFAPVSGAFSRATKTLHAFRNAGGVFARPTPITNMPSSRMRVASRV